MDESGQGAVRDHAPRDGCLPLSAHATRTINYHVRPCAAYRSKAERGTDDKETSRLRDCCVFRSNAPALTKETDESCFTDIYKYRSYDDVNSL